MRAFLFRVVLFAVLAASLANAGEIYEYSENDRTFFYEYKDRDGLSHFTDNLRNIPEEYKSHTIIKKKKLPEVLVMKPVPSQTAHSGEEKPTADQSSGSSAKEPGNRLFRVLSAAALMMLFFVVLNMVGAKNSFRNAVIIMRAVLAIAVLFYIFSTYQKEFTEKFSGNGNNCFFSDPVK